MFSACASSKLGPLPFEDRDRCLQRVFRIRKPPGVAVEIAELRQQDSRDLVVRAEALPCDCDGLFGQRNRFGLLPGLVEPDDLLVHGREVALRGGVLHRTKGCNREGQTEKYQAEAGG